MIFFSVTPLLSVQLCCRLTSGKPGSAFWLVNILFSHYHNASLDTCWVFVNLKSYCQY